MNTAHTPGPWMIEPAPADSGLRIREKNPDPSSPPRIGIAHVYQYPRSSANARLIAAAPELLAVVQRLFHSVNGFSATFSAVNTDYACSQLRKEITETIREAQNALAKATAT